MAMMTTGTAGLSSEFQTIFSKELLKRPMQALVLDQFAQRMPFPKEAGSKTMRFFRKQAGAATNVSTLTEGVALTTYNEIALDYVEATLVQYGQLYKISDVMTYTNLFDTLKESIDSMAENTGLHADQIIRDEVVAAITAAGNKRYAGGAANFNALVALSATAGAMTITDLLDAMTQLTLQRAPLKNNEYFMIVPPQIYRDLLNDVKFINLSVYQNNTNIMKGEVGKWYNIRVIVDTVPWREANTNGTEGTYAASGPIFTSIVTGSESFGTPIMAGQSPFSPRVMISDSADKVDPLNQYVMAGCKFFWTSKTLNPLWTVTIRSKTGFA